jgi:uncharacterized membrane protein YgcG
VERRGRADEPLPPQYHLTALVTYCTLSVTFSHLTTTSPPLAKLKEIMRMPQQRTGAAGGGGEGGGGGGSGGEGGGGGGSGAAAAHVTGSEAQ